MTNHATETLFKATRQGMNSTERGAGHEGLLLHFLTEDMEGMSQKSGDKRRTA